MQSLANIKQSLTELKPHLIKKYNISTIGLSGSVTRSDFSATSDIDILVDFHTAPGIEFIDLAEELEMKLGYRVDLVSKHGIKPGYLGAIESDLIYV